MSKIIAAAALAVALSWAIASAWAAGGPPVGVYGCYDPHMRYNPARNTFELQIEIAPVIMFGIIDGTTYSDFDGRRGHYTYNAGTGILTMTDGSRQGWRYRKKKEWSFALIGNTDGKDHYECPLNAKKDPSRHPW